MSCPKCGSHRVKDKQGLWATCAGCGERLKCGTLSDSLFNHVIKRNGQRVAILRRTGESEVYLGWLGKKGRILDDFKSVLGHVKDGDGYMLESDFLWSSKAGNIELPESENQDSRNQFQEWLETK